MAVTTTRAGTGRVAGHAAEAQDTASEAAHSALQTMAYGVVYATVFIAQSLPQENPIMHGFRDGGREAMDELDGN